MLIRFELVDYFEIYFDLIFPDFELPNLNDKCIT